MQMMLDFILSELQRGIIGECVIVYLFLKALFYVIERAESRAEIKSQNKILIAAFNQAKANTLINFKRYAYGVPEWQFKAYMNRVLTDAKEGL